MFGHRVAKALQERDLRGLQPVKQPGSTQVTAENLTRSTRERLEQLYTELIELRSLIIDPNRFESYKDIKLDYCRLCLRGPGERRESDHGLNSDRLVRHHILPREYYGNDNDYFGETRKFLVVCNKHHEVIHGQLRKIRNEKGRENLTEDDFYQAIRMTIDKYMIQCIYCNRLLKNCKHY